MQTTMLDLKLVFNKNAYINKALKLGMLSVILNLHYLIRTKLKYLNMVPQMLIANYVKKQLLD